MLSRKAKGDSQSPIPEPMLCCQDSEGKLGREPRVKEEMAKV